MNNIKQILLAEDNPRDAELTIMALEDTQSEIILVKDGAEALDFFYRKGKYSARENVTPIAAIIDLKMPKVDGLQVLKQIKHDNKFRMIPVVMLSSSNEERDLIESYKYGVNAYVVKPVDFDKYISAIKQTGFFWGVINEVPYKGRELRNEENT